MSQYPIIRGSGSGSWPVQQPYKEQYSPSNGNIITKTWRGTYGDGSATDVGTLIPGLKDAGYEYTLLQEGKGGIWRLEATIGNDVLENTWEVLGEDTQKDILNSTLPDVQNLSNSSILILRVMMEHFADFKGTPPGPPQGASSLEVASFYVVQQNIIAGMRTVPFALPIVRRSYIATRQYLVTDSALFVNYPFARSTLIGSEGVPSIYWPVLPQTGPSSIGTLAVNYGYMKKSPKIELSTKGRVRVSQEWIYDAWSSILGPLI